MRTKYTAENYSIYDLKALLQRHDESLCKADGSRQSAAALEAEEKSLLESADLDDPNTMDRIKEVRLKKEMAMASAARLARGNEEIESAVREECSALIAGLEDVLSKKYSDCVMAIAGTIQGFFVDRPQAALSAAAEVFNTTNLGIKYGQLFNYLRTTGIQSKPAFFLAKEILELSPKVALLNVTLEPSPDEVPLWEVKSVERLEDEELERLLTPMGFEERVQIIMDGSRNGTPRAKAEKSVQGRIDHLKAAAERRKGAAAK